MATPHSAMSVAMHVRLAVEPLSQDSGDTWGHKLSHNTLHKIGV